MGLAALLLVRWDVTADLRPVRDQNVLLITVDTLRADALGSFGGPAATPALDGLAHAGVRFTFAHAHAVLTLPSHASVLTGQYPFQHGIRDNSGYRLPPGTPTLATRLKQAGYSTAAFVAAFPLHSRFGLNAGFDVYDDRFGETRAPTEFVMPERPASVVVPLARDWIARQDAARKWFSWVHVFDPHAPYEPPPPFDRQYADRPYYGEVAAVDRALAPLLDDIRRSPRPTLIVVTGDHGEALGDHGEATHGLFAYESTLRIPLIIAELGGTGARRPPASGEVSTAPVAHVDILPTILDAIGLAAPTDVPGRSLLPPAERRPGSPRTSYFEAMAAMLNRGWAPLTGVIVDRDKYIDLPELEVYDLATDPGERSNLAGRTPERERFLQASFGALGATLPGRRHTESPEALDRLRALGYVAGEAPVKTRYTEADDPKRLADLDSAVHHAVELYGTRRFDGAAQLYRQIIARRPDMALAYRHLAFVEWQVGRTTAAIGVLRQALRAGVRHGGLTTQLGTYLADSGEAREAIGLLEPEASRGNADPEALNALGIAYARAGRPDEARRIFEDVLKRTPESAMPFENLGALDLGRGDFAAARRHFEHAVEIDERSSQAHAGLGVVAVKSGDRKTAISEWTKAVTLDPTNYDALYNLATNLLGDGQREAARPYLDQFVRTAPAALYGPDIREVTRLLQGR